MAQPVWVNSQKDENHFTGCFIGSVAEVDVGKTSRIDSVVSTVVSGAD